MHAHVEHVLDSCFKNCCFVNHKQKRKMHNEQLIENAALAVKRILDDTRHPKVPSKVAHRYEDKYLFAEYLTRCGAAAQLNALDAMGLGKALLEKLVEASQVRHRVVMLQFSSVESCEFVRKQQRVLEPAYDVERTTTISESGVFGASSTKISSKTKTTVNEFVYKFEVQYELYLSFGSSSADKFVLKENRMQVEIATTSENLPHPARVVNAPRLCDVSWLAKHLSSDVSEVQFSINRNRKYVRKKHFIPLHFFCLCVCVCVFCFLKIMQDSSPKRRS